MFDQKWLYLQFLVIKALDPGILLRFETNADPQHWKRLMKHNIPAYSFNLEYGNQLSWFLVYGRINVSSSQFVNFLLLAALLERREECLDIFG